MAFFQKSIRLLCPSARRRVERDVKAVHGDVTALLNAGLLSKTDDGMIVFPYDAIHVDFMLKAA